MNYLAHLYFSDADALAWAGSLMGDFHKGANFGTMPDQLVRHIRLHRFVDAYTNQDPDFRISCRRLNPQLRFARSIVIDVFYDHFLACHWDRFSAVGLEQFAATVYAALESRQAELDRGLLNILPHMIANDWLSSYRLPEIVARVLNRLEMRLGHKFPLSLAFEELEQYRQLLLDDFVRFMASAGSVVYNWKASHPLVSSSVQELL